jgi:hypothetical protein
LLSQQKLVKNINKKHKADGATSILKVTLSKNKIDLDKDEANMAAAVTADNGMKNFQGLARKAKNDRDENFEPAFGFLKVSVQFLKNQSGGKVVDIVNWGVSVEGDSVVYPAGFAERNALWVKFWGYHISLVAASPLIGFAADNGYSLSDLNAGALLAPGFNDDMNVNLASAETQRNERDKVWVPVRKHIGVVGKSLKTYYVTNPSKAGDWGFVVDSSPRAAKDRKVMLKLGQQRTISNCKVGGKIKNVGDESVTVYRGKGVVGVSFVLAKGEEKGIEKGMSRLTILNNSLLNSATVVVLASA